jgi:hypothetical protein
LEKTPFPAKVKEHSTLISVLKKSAKKAVEPDEHIIIKSPVAIVKDLVTKNVGDEHIVFCEDASNIVSHPSRSRKTSASAIPFKLYREIMHEMALVNLKKLMWLFSLLIEKLSLQLVLLEMWKFYAVRLNTLLIF